MANPELAHDERVRLVRQLMTARRTIAAAKKLGDERAERQARAMVDRAKRALGERGPTWWKDGAPDYNRRMVRGTPYAEWFAAHSSAQEPHWLRGERRSRLIRYKK